MKLLTVKPLEEIFDAFKVKLKNYKRETIRIKTEDAVGFTTSEDVLSENNVPDFNRSTVDGYALNYIDTVGASENVPVFLHVACSIDMGEDVKAKLKRGECAYIPTGGMLPENANAVAMVEYSEQFDKHTVAINKSLSFHSNVIEIGEDVKKGEVLIKKDTFIRTQEMASLLAMGIKEIEVYKPFRVTIISTGDELVSIENTSLNKGSIYDINSHILKNLVQEDGFDLTGSFLIKDDFDLIKRKVLEQYNNSDIIIISGGSSKGEKDNTVHVFDSICKDSVFVHGAAIRPGKPTICAYDNKREKILIGLPGNPVAAMMVYKMIVGYLCEYFNMRPRRKKRIATLKTNVPGSVGRAIIQPLRIVETDGDYLAYPVFIKSALISGLTRADAFTIIGINKEGLKAGEKIEFEFME